MFSTLTTVRILRIVEIPDPYDHSRAYDKYMYVKLTYRGGGGDGPSPAPLLIILSTNRRQAESAE